MQQLADCVRECVAQLAGPQAPFKNQKESDVKQGRRSLEDIQSEFLNVDLEVKSRTDTAPLVRAFGKSVMCLYVDRIRRRHLLRLMLSPSARQPKSPTNAILGFVRLVEALPPIARRIWSQATKEFDIGFQGGVHPSSAEWVVSDKAVQAAARCGAHIRFTLYSPQLLVDAETSKKARAPRRRVR